MKTLIATLAVVALAGCGSSSNTSSTSSSPSGGGSGATTTTAPASTGGGATTIRIKGFAFIPASKTVKVGQKVTWTNEDSTAHNVSGGPLRSPTLNQGQSYSYTPTKAGTISYVCTFHANMKATLKVVA